MKGKAMRKVYLHGALAKHGDCFDFEVATGGEAIAALCVNFPGFETDLRKGSWVVLRGDPETGMVLDEDAVAGMRLGNADLHFMPEVIGAKNSSGALKAILGITLIAITGGAAAPFLANPIMTGVASGATWGNAIGQIGLAIGGYLAPEEFGSELIKLLEEYSPIRKYARVVNISAPEITYPRRVTGTAATWVTEVANRTASGMTFEQVKLTPYELATFTDISNQLLEDNAYNLEGELLSDFAESFGNTEGVAFVKGTGVDQPKGIM